MKRVAGLIVALAVVIAAVRAALSERTPTYRTWSEYLADDREGDAIAPRRSK